MSKGMKHTWLLTAIVIAIGVAGCSGKKKSGGAAGSGGNDGVAANGGSGAGNGAGSGGSSGNTGTGQAGNTAHDAQVGDAMAGLDAALDAGHDAGPALLKCSAPSPATSAGNTCPSSDPVTLKKTKVGMGFNYPIFVTHSPNDPDKRLFVVERFGKIQIIKNGTTLSTPFFDITPVSGQEEQGLLGLAFDPNYETTGRFWVDYIGQNGGLGTQSVIESYTVSSDPDVAEASSKKPLITLEDPEWNHNGGMLAFGTDNCLYIGAGDGGGGDDQHSNHGADGNAQSLKTGLGKILRIDVEDPQHAAPGNLTADIPWIWDYGVRNPWRFSFDRESGDMYIGDVGQGKWEEIDVEPRGKGKRNYGWRFMEGTHCDGDVKGTPAPTSCSGHAPSEFVPPIHEWYHENGDNCAIGGYVYRGSKIPSLKGWYIFGDHGSRRVWALVWDGTKACKTPIDLTSQLGSFDGNGNITSFGEDVDGEIYITTSTGYVYRIDPA